MVKLNEYQNGNVQVMMFSDGTKIREYSGVPSPVHPESIDIKITNWCDAGCTYCHESSTTRGVHADVAVVRHMIDGLPPGVELAIGGGDPFSHPAIATILQEISDRGLIANITVNGKHIYRHYDAIHDFRNRGLIYGLGISFAAGMYECYDDYFDEVSDQLGRPRNLSDIVDDRTIVHFIAGEHSPKEVFELMRVHPKILVLGYKNFGRGVRHNGPRVNHLLGAWRYWIGSMISRGVVCFDNLALEQLQVQKWLPTDLWEKFYMGDDGSFTMYADAIRGEYALKSTAVQRESCAGLTAMQYFQKNRVGATATAKELRVIY